jgi:hypothetical protein
LRWGSHQFDLRVTKGKAVNNIKESTVAQDLLLILQQSRKASELMETGLYDISMDKHFILHINKIEESL